MSAILEVIEGHRGWQQNVCMRIRLLLLTQESQEYRCALENFVRTCADNIRTAGIKQAWRARLGTKVSAVQVLESATGISIVYVTVLFNEWVEVTLTKYPDRPLQT